MSNYNYGPLEHELAGGTFADNSAEYQQPVREGGEWLTELRERNEERKRAFAVWKERGILIESQPIPDMITDIDRLLRVAALVPGLVGTITELLNQFYPHQCHIENGTCRRCDILRSASQLLNTVTREREK